MLFRICLLSALVALAGALLEPGTFHRDALIEKPVKENGALPVVRIIMDRSQSTHKLVLEGSIPNFLAGPVAWHG